jgi:glycosyltransferase involved in cell wall biosynthesis
VPCVTVTIAGDGPERAALEARAAGLGLADCARFVGRVPHERLPALLGEAAAYVSTSRSDSTSISLLEAMAAGATPVISDIPGNREWLTEDSARFFPVGDASALARGLIEVLGNAEFRRAGRLANRARVERDGDWAANVSRIEARYATLVAGKAAVA